MAASVREVVLPSAATEMNPFPQYWQFMGYEDIPTDPLDNAIRLRVLGVVDEHLALLR